jgi:drug/metabolite transporter (DMT)-like permease
MYQQSPLKYKTATNDLCRICNRFLTLYTFFRMTNDTAAREGQPDIIHDNEYPSGMRLAAIVGALVLGIFLASLDATIITTAIPSITEEFHSLQDVGWYGSALFFPLAATQSLWGKAYKYFPIKSAFLLSIVIFEVGSLLCGKPLPVKFLQKSK